MNIQMMFHPWTSPDGVHHLPGMVDRDAYPEIPEDCFWSKGPGYVECITQVEWGLKPPAALEIQRLRDALLGLRDTDQEEGDDQRVPGPCWCPGWVNTRRGGHTKACAQARAAIGVEP